MNTRKNAALVLGFITCLMLGFFVSRAVYRREARTDPWDTIGVQLKDSNKSLSFSELRKTSDASLVQKERGIDLTSFGTGIIIYDGHPTKLLDLHYYRGIGSVVYVL